MHRSALIIRNDTLCVRKSDNDNFNISRPLSEEMCSKNKTILEATLDKYNGVVDSS